MSDSFWTIPETDSDRFPLVLLKKQASALTEQTNGTLRGEVSTMNLGGILYITLSISVPSLNNYKTNILEYRQPLQIFPGSLELAFGKGNFEIRSYENFAEILKEYLSSAEMKRLIAALIAQARA